MVNNLEKVKELIYKVERAIKKQTGLDSTHRFWTFMLTRLIVGISIANYLKLTSCDIKAFTAYLIGLIDTTKKNENYYVSDRQSLIAQMFSDLVNNRLIVKTERRKVNNDRFAMGAMNDHGYVSIAPTVGKTPHIRIAQDTGVSYIHKHAITEWCKPHSVDPKDLIAYMVEHYQASATPVSKDIGDGTQLRTGKRASCIKYITPPDEIPRLDEETN